MTQLNYVGVVHGNASYGQLIGDGQAIPVVSGRFGNGYVPAGQYKVGGPEETYEKTMRTPESFKKKKSTQKYRLAAVGKPTKWMKDKDGVNKLWFWDENAKKWRTGILIHYDGGTPGTMGCIGYIDPKYEPALKEMLAKGGNIDVTYHKSVADAQAHATKLSGKDAPAVDFSNKYKTTAAAPKKKKGTGKGKPSKTKKGAQVVKGEKTVVVGKRQLEAAHKNGKVTGGKVKKGSRGVFLGKKRWPFARVADATDQGPIGTGVDHVMVG